MNLTLSISGWSTLIFELKAKFETAGKGGLIDDYEESNYEVLELEIWKSVHLTITNCKQDCGRIGCVELPKGEGKKFETRDFCKKERALPSKEDRYQVSKGSLKRLFYKPKGKAHGVLGFEKGFFRALYLYLGRELDSDSSDFENKKRLAPAIEVLAVPDAPEPAIKPDDKSGEKSTAEYSDHFLVKHNFPEVNIADIGYIGEISILLYHDGSVKTDIDRIVAQNIDSQVTIKALRLTDNLETKHNFLEKAESLVVFTTDRFTADDYHLVDKWGKKHRELPFIFVNCGTDKNPFGWKEFDREDVQSVWPLLLAKAIFRTNRYRIFWRRWFAAFIGAVSLLIASLVFGYCRNLELNKAKTEAEINSKLMLQMEQKAVMFKYIAKSGLDVVLNGQLTSYKQNLKNSVQGLDLPSMLGMNIWVMSDSMYQISKTNETELHTAPLDTSVVGYIAQKPGKDIFTVIVKDGKVDRLYFSSTDDFELSPYRGPMPKLLPLPQADSKLEDWGGFLCMGISTDKFLCVDFSKVSIPIVCDPKRSKPIRHEFQKTAQYLAEVLKPR